MADALYVGDIVQLPDDAPDGYAGLLVVVLEVDGEETTFSLPYCDMGLTRPYVPLILSKRQREARLAEFERQRRAWPVEPIAKAITIQ